MRLPPLPIHSVRTMSARNGPSWPAKLYAQARPDYPAPILDALLDAPAATSPLHVFDIGAGTGICSRALIEACQKSRGTGHHLASITSLDAAPNMLEELSETLYAPGGLVPALQKKGELDAGLATATGVSKFEDFDAGKFGMRERVDLITIAQAWHWCSDWETSLGNMADALRPGGVLALVWNLEDREAASWVAQVRDLYERYEHGTPQYRHNYWHAMYKTNAIERFDILPPKKVTRAIPTTVEGVCDRVKSKSYISVISAKEQDDLTDSIRQLLKSGSDEELQRTWIDAEKGVFAYPYSTDLIMLRKK